MKDNTKRTDITKNIIIILLAISAAYLLFRSVAFEPSSTVRSLSAMFDRKYGKASTVSPGNDNSFLGTDPLFMLVTAKDGSHYALKYNVQGKKEIFSDFSSALGEALGSSEAPVQISADTFQQALHGSGIFFDYLYSQPLASIAARLGTDISVNISEKSARRIFLGSNGDKLQLYFIDGNSGAIYLSNTALSFSSISTKISDFPLGDSKFSFEMGADYVNIDPYFIFTDENESLSALSASNPIQNISPSSIMELFGMNSHTCTDLIDGGSHVYVDGKMTLRIDDSGKVLFSAPEGSGPFITADTSVSKCISDCSGIVENSIGSTSGDSTIGLTRASASSPSFLEISFGYFAGGISVLLPGDDYAANFQINNGYIVGAELYFRKYASTGTMIMALPEKQAVQIAKASGGEPVLVYADNSTGVSGTWIIN